MNLRGRTITNLRRSVAWHSAALVSRAVHARHFGSLGSGSVIMRPFNLSGVDRIHVGDRCALVDGVWLVVEKGDGAIHIGDDVSFAPGCHVHAADLIRIGDRCVFAEGVYVGSAEHGLVDRSAVLSSGPVTIGADVFIGIRSVVLGGVTIGDGATVGAHAVVTRDVPPGATVAGVPARILRPGPAGP